MRHIGLFEGIGGFSLAAQWMGWETIAWCENNPFCQKVLKHHFPNAIPHGDIKTIDFSVYRGKCDLLTVGFPCKQTSIGAAIHGKRNGLDGKDSGLWFEYLRVVREVIPDWVIVENPSGIKKWEEIIKAGLENAGTGYVVSRLENTACSLGFPHQRRRYFYVANRYGQRLALTRQERSSSTKWYERLATYGGSWLSTTPGTIGGFNGLPNRVDRTTALGNALMPQQAFQIFKAIELFMKHNRVE